MPKSTPRRKMKPAPCYPSQEQDKGTPEADGSEPKRRWASPGQWLTAAIATAIVILIDQISKLLIVTNIEVGERVVVINPYLWFTYAQNEQGIFSLSFGPAILYFILPLVAVGFVIWLLLRPQTRFVTVLLGIIVGGGIGNFLDRVRLGYVVDWISMGFKNWRWATYNVADGAIVVGVILLLVKELFFTRKKPTPDETPSEPPEGS